jgi:hypothetical protein
MTALAKAFLSTIPAISSDIANFETVALFSGAGLLVCLLLTFYGVDMAVGAAF